MEWANGWGPTGTGCLASASTIAQNKMRRRLQCCCIDDPGSSAEMWQGALGDQRRIVDIARSLGASVMLMLMLRLWASASWYA